MNLLSPPNIGRSSLSPKGYSKKVKINKKPVAIKGATFASQGDIASKALGGGLVSANTHGPTKFVGPGALDVKIEGKNVQLLSDPMLNNCGPGGNPPNSATLQGVIQLTGLVMAVRGKACPICNENHGDLSETKSGSKADAEELAREYHNYLPYIGRDEKTGGAAWGSEGAKTSTMLGVVVCKCGKAKWADQSGRTTDRMAGGGGRDDDMKKTEIEGAAKKAGMTAWFATSDKHTPAQITSAVKNVSGAHWDANAFKRKLQEADTAVEASAKSAAAPGANEVGQCAGQGAMLLLIDDKGRAAEMTEQFYKGREAEKRKRTAKTYDPVKSGDVTGSPYSHELEQHGGPAIGACEPFGHGATVPPCKTCVLILPFLLCTGKRQECEAHEKKGAR